MVIIGLQSEVMALTKFVHFVNPFIKNDRFRHQNIVELMGFCNSDEVSAILYRYMENGSLYDHLHEVIHCF